ncbi:ATP-grasp domain-containing protein [bacterium]|nr:MAG: ATP-grasp domain-containing protein [bacterium]
MSDFSILFTSVGRRVDFIQQMRSRLPKSIRIICADQNADAPALSFGDAFATLPPVTQDDFPGRLLDLCQAERVSVVVPLIDTELPVYAQIKDEMSLFGVHIIISDRTCIDLCRDKLTFGYFLEEKGISTPRIIDFSETNIPKELCLRERFGSRSVGMRKINSKEVDLWIRKRDKILTEWVYGTEYTVDALIEKNGSVSIVVPRKRTLVRDGESIIGETVKDDVIIQLAYQIFSLIPGLYGPVCLQLIDSGNDFYITELNARFAGGITLSIAAGAGFPEWLAAQVNNTELETYPEWISGKKMHRYLMGKYV